MGNDEVWDKFLPKIRRLNCSSGLSQMSTTSLVSRDGRLSLSSRVNTRDSLKDVRLLKEPAITPPRPSTSSNSSPFHTPTERPKTRTPSTTRKRSSKKNTPSDGKSQTSLYSYFPVSPKEWVPFQERVPDIVTLDSCSDEENNVLCEKNLEKATERKKNVPASVSRVLFPTTSTANDKHCGNTLIDTRGCLSPNCGKDKENRLSSPVVHSKSTEGVERTTEKASESTAILKKISSRVAIGDDKKSDNWHTFRANQQVNIASPVTAVENEVHHSAVGPSNASSPVPLVSSLLGNLVENMGNQPNLRDNFDKGKKKMNASEISNDSRGREICHSQDTKKQEVNSQQPMKKIQLPILPNPTNGETSLRTMSSVPRSARGNASLHEPSQGVQQCQPSHDPMENFTGVTESAGIESSGDFRTPGSLSCYSSDEFDDTNTQKVVTTKRLHKKKKSKTNDCVLKGKESKNESRKGQVSKGNITLKPTRKVNMNTTCKGSGRHTSEVKTVADVNGHSKTKSLLGISIGEDSSQPNISDVDTFTNSGGFFQDEESLERPSGQAFVIRYPSVEYLQNYGSILDESSILIENDIACSDDETENSSVLIGLSAIDAVSESLQTLDQTVPVKLADKSVDINSHSHSNSIASTIPAGSGMQNIDYPGGLHGVTLTEAEWDNLPTQSKSSKTPKMITGGANNTYQSLASTPIHCINRNATLDAKLSTKSEIVKGRQSSQELLTERAVSPNEGEEAPFNGMIVTSGQGACQLGASIRAIMSPYSHGMSSQSTEILLSSAIAPIGSPKVIQSVSPNKEDLAEKLASRQKVLDWISSIPETSGSIHTEELSGSQADESLDYQRSALQMSDKGDEKGIQENNRKKISVQNPNVSSSGKCNSANGKSCQILCQLEALITFSYKKQGGRLEIIRKNCMVKNKCHQKRDKFQKTNAMLTAKVFEIPGTQNNQLRSENSKKQWLDNSKMGSKRTSQLPNQIRGSLCNHVMKNISVNVKAMYGKWGWEGLEIECLDEGCCDSNNSLCNENMKSSMLSIEKVRIEICECSRTLSVKCIILHNNVNVGDNSFEGSKFHTSLKHFESCWGVPDNPVTLSAVAYSKISTIFSNKLASNATGCVNAFVEVEESLPDSLSQNLHDVDKDTPKAVFGTTSQDGTSRIRKSAPGHSELSQQIQEAGDSSLSDLDDSIPTDSSDLGWMTQGREASKRYTIDQWEPLMKKMREGKKSSESSQSTFPSSDTASSSFISTSSQGTYSVRGQRGRARYTQERRSRVCPFYKKIEGTRFAVDAFSYGSIPGITHYFLSHFHYDHYMGLTRNFSHPIYCSSVTAKLVALKVKVEPNFIRKIDPGQTIKVDGVTVTALDANHCPGSVMFLFQLPGGTTHLHVGDFRAHVCMESYQAFWNIYVDRLYLDTTYCDPRYTFSSQERVIDNVLSIVDSAITKDPKTLIVCGSYTIGKERVFAAITERFKFKVWAPADKRRVLQCVREGLQELRFLGKNSPGVSEGGAARELNLIEALAMLSTVKEDAQIHVLPMAKIDGECLKEHLFSLGNRAFTNIVAFRPTGWTHRPTKGLNESNLLYNSTSVKIYGVAYSEHSSFLEMARFVKFIKPKTVVKTVNVGSARERETMDVHINSWLKEVRSKVLVPNRNNESPKSSQVTEKQREAGDFMSGKRKNFMGRLTTSLGIGLKPLVADNLKNSSESTCFTGSYLESKQIEERTSYESPLHFGGRKRIGSPIGNEMTPKRQFK